MRRILFYLVVWAALFLGLCVISVVKNWETLVQVLGSQVTALGSVILGGALSIGISILGIWLLFRALLP